jgi:hypothetical protein
MLQVCCPYCECMGHEEVTMTGGNAGYIMNVDFICPQLVNSRETWRTPNSFERW